MNALLTAVTLVASLSTAQVAVTTPDPINVEPGAARALATVCALAYTDASGLPAVAPANDEALAAVASNARVELRLIGLDGIKQRRLIVNATRRSPEGVVEHQVTLEAAGLEDAQVVCARIATALWNKQAVEDTQTRTTVTIAESTRKTRRVSNTNKSFGVKTGFTGAFVADQALAPIGSIGFDARIGGERWFAQLGAGILVPANLFGTATSYGGISLDVGANYYLTDTDFAPYVGGGVMPRLVFSGSVFNLAPYLQAGFTVSRKGGVHLNVDARVAQNVLPTIGQFGTGMGALPTELSLNLGVGF